MPDYDTPVQNAGGENNAWTNNDITNYYITPIQPDVVDPEDIEMLQDLIISAVNEVMRTVEDTTNEEMEKITGPNGGGMPGLF